MLTVRELLERESMCDSALVRHGFTDYMRDYELIVSHRNGDTFAHRYLFVGCVEAHCETSVPPGMFAASLGDEFVHAGPHAPDVPAPDGFIWGVRWAELYPGLSYINRGLRAQFWSEQLGRPMHEVVIETNAYHLRLVFADIRYACLGSAEDHERAPDQPLPVAPADRTSDGDVPSVKAVTTRVTSFAPQLLVDDLVRSLKYYRKLGFSFGVTWGGFYAIGKLDGIELHLKEAPKRAAERRQRREHEHLDAAAGVDGIEAFYARCVANGVAVFKPLAAATWGTKGLLRGGPGRQSHRLRGPSCQGVSAAATAPWLAPSPDESLQLTERPGGPCGVWAATDG